MGYGYWCISNNDLVHSPEATMKKKLFFYRQESKTVSFSTEEYITVRKAVEVLKAKGFDTYLQIRGK